jgi:hypothetical protein
MKKIKWTRENREQFVHVAGVTVNIVVEPGDVLSSKDYSERIFSALSDHPGFEPIKTKSEVKQDGGI